MDKQVTELTSKAIAVEVPEDAHSFEIYENNVIGGWCVMFLRGQPDYACEYSPNLPEGSWSILGRPKSMTEEQWKGIVDNWHYGTGRLQKAEPNQFEDYSGESNFFQTAAESGLSLLKSKGLNPQNILVLIKQ